MATNIHGWTGKILKVNLNESKLSELDTFNYSKRYLGGRGIATAIYWEEVKPETKPFDPENALVMISGAIVGTGAMGATRLEVVSKSPMTRPEGFCYGNLGGFFPAYLKRGGYDGVVITGKSEKPCYLNINDGQAELVDASDLWGLGTYDVSTYLKEKYGKNTRFISTGPAGENKCRTATIITDHEGSATGGFGAVMGSKNFKAISVNGTKKPSIAQPETLKKLNKEILNISARGPLRMPVSKKDMTFVKTASCFQCGLDCGRGLYRTVESGVEVVRKCQSMIVYSMFSKGAKEPVETSLNATKLCNDYSICTMEMQTILLYLGAAYGAGFLDDKKTDLEFAKLGKKEFIEKLVKMIANREGFGDILAEGIIRIDKKLGEKARSYFNEYTYGVGLGGAYSPRQYNINALLYGLEPRQPIAMLHDVSHLIARWLLHLIRPNLSATSAEVFRKAAGKFWGHEKAWDLTTYEGKAEATVKIQDHTYVKDSLGLCDFGWPIMDSLNTKDHTGDPTYESQLFSAISGIETDMAQLDLYGQRIVNLQRAILLREGWKAVADDSPQEFNFTEPIEFDMLNPNLIVPGPTEEPVSVKGNVLDREKFHEMRKTYYKLRGWDTQTGFQKKETLERLDMTDVAEELSRLGLIS